MRDHNKNDRKIEPQQLHPKQQYQQAARFHTFCMLGSPLNKSKTKNAHNNTIHKLSKGTKKKSTIMTSPNPKQASQPNNDTTITKKPSTATIILGFVFLNGMLFVVVSFNLLMLIGSFCYPTSIGLLTLAYYSYTIGFDRCEMDGMGRHWTWFSQNFRVFQYMRNYLKLKLVTNEKLTALDNSQGSSRSNNCRNDDDDENDETCPPQMIFAVFPHGSNSDFRVLMDGILHTILPNTASNIRSLAATVLFRIPLIRELTLWTGCIDASKPSAIKALKKGNSLLIVPGGQVEQIQTQYGSEHVYLKRRKGFIKLALTYDIPVIPVYVFGCSDYYFTFNFAKHIQLWIVKNLGISIPLAFGQFGSSHCPFPIPTTIVFGEPLHFSNMKKVEAPKEEENEKEEEKSPKEKQQQQQQQQQQQLSSTEVDKAHEMFCNSLQALFDSHKDELGYGDRTLHIS